jgi:hypothetical protein
MQYDRSSGNVLVLMSATTAFSAIPGVTQLTHVSDGISNTLQALMRILLEVRIIDLVTECGERHLMQ